MASAPLRPALPEGPTAAQPGLRADPDDHPPRGGLTIPAQARPLGASPRKTEPRPTNSGAQLTRVVAAATVVRPREAFQRAKWTARNSPEAPRRARSARSSAPTRPRGANGASTTAPARQRQKARASAGMAATRIRIGEVEMATPRPHPQRLNERRAESARRPGHPGVPGPSAPTSGLAGSPGPTGTVQTGPRTVGRGQVGGGGGSGACPSWAATAASTRTAAPEGPGSSARRRRAQRPLSTLAPRTSSSR